MKLSPKALAKARKPETRMKIGIELRCTDQTIVKYINRNEDNGPLTSAGALKVIREETKLNDAEILEEEKAAV